MFKRVVSYLLLLVALLSLVPFNALATTPSTIDTEADDELAEYMIYDGVRKSVYVNGTGQNAVCVFMPEYSDTYIFTAYASNDTLGFIYDDTGSNQLGFDDDSGENRNFRISIYLEAGQTYLLGTRFYYSSAYGYYDIEIYGTHAHSYDNACDATCNICNKERTVSHNYVTNDCLEEKTCSVCGQPSGIIPGHIYDYDCDANCNVCGKNREASHKWVGGTCTVAATCEFCGAKSKAPGHSYTNVCDSSCNACGGGRTAPHSYKTVIKKATLTQDGYTVKECALCRHQTGKKTIYKASKITVSATSFTYNGKAQKPKVTVKDSAGNTISTSNYQITYSSGCTNAGTYKVTVKFSGNYSGTKTISYTIKKQTSSKVNVTLNKTVFAYNKKTRTPSITLKDTNGRKLTNKTDYTISYPSGRKNVGKYKITITLKGNYSGSKTVYYTIAPTAKEKIDCYIGQTIEISAKSNAKITYSSSNKKIATVSSKGVITALKSGTVTITVKSSKLSQKITVKVRTPKIEITASKSSMYIGESQTIKSKLTPSGGKITWSVSSKKLASISSSGKLTARGKGTVTVTATYKYKGKTYKDTCKVKIDVEYPNVSVFISSKSAYSDVYAINIENKSNRSLKVLNRGYVYCYGDSANIETLFSGKTSKYCKSITIPKGGEETLVMCLDEKMLLLQTKTTYAYIYVEYGGELFKLSCNTSRYGLNKCSTVTWMIQD